MPLIEELPVTQTTRVTHGWAYVPDTGLAIQAVQPGTRKRGAARDGGARGRGDFTAKLQRAREKRLADLEKENHKDIPIPIPPRPKDRSKKMTSNVRRILTYQRTFAHYLADEEALLTQIGGGNTVVLPPLPQQKTEGKKKDTTAEASPAPASTTSKRKSTQHHHPPATPSSTTTTTTTKTSVGTETGLDQLLTLTDLPKPPTERVMTALLAEPPLTYKAARCTTKQNPSTTTPHRHFCCVCGYWGTVRCRQCGDRTCSSRECYSTHHEAHLGL